jgi:hypothetical protein
VAVMCRGGRVAPCASSQAWHLQHAWCS